MFLKYDLKDPVANHTFSGLLNINNVALVETHWVGQNGKKIEVHLLNSVILLYKSSIDNVDKVYNGLVNLIKDDPMESLPDLGELGTMEIL